MTIKGLSFFRMSMLADLLVSVNTIRIKFSITETTGKPLTTIRINFLLAEIIYSVAPFLLFTLRLKGWIVNGLRLVALRDTQHAHISTHFIIICSLLGRGVDDGFRLGEILYNVRNWIGV